MPGVFQVTFLDYVVYSSKFCPIQDKVNAIQTFPRTSTVRQLCLFLGILNFYRANATDIQSRGVITGGYGE